MAEKPRPRGRPPKPISKIDMPPRHQPSKAELEEPIHLPGQSPEDVARIVMQGGAPRRDPENTES